jgi:hypothetical protein
MPSAEEIFSRTRSPVGTPRLPVRAFSPSRLLTLSPLGLRPLTPSPDVPPPCSRCASGGLIPAGGTPGPGRIGLGWASRFFLSYSPAIAVMGVVALAEGGADWRRGLRARARGREDQRARGREERARRREGERLGGVMSGKVADKVGRTSGKGRKATQGGRRGPEGT